MMMQVQYRAGDRLPWRVVDPVTGATLGATDGTMDDAERLAATLARVKGAGDGQ